MSDQQVAPATKGVTVELLSTVDLGPEIEGMAGRKFRMRLVTSIISAYYYLKVVVIMYMHPGEPTAAADVWVRFTAVVAAIAVVVLGIIPGPLLSVAVKAILRVQ